MKEQINRLARGVFRYEPLTVKADEEHIKLSVSKNTGLRSSFTVSEKSGQSIRGIVYSDNDFVALENNTFSGSNNIIYYNVTADSMEPSDIIKGSFHIVSDAGECEVDYSFTVISGAFESSCGEIKNLEGLAMLAKSRPEEAEHFFESDDFSRIFVNNNLSYHSLYEGLSKGGNTGRSLEEFLVGTGMKKTVGVRLLQQYVEFTNVTENFKETVSIELDTWGYVHILVSTDSEFIKLERNVIEPELFAGGRYELAYIIDVNALHPGKNFGRIYFENAGNRTSCEICVITSHGNGNDHGNNAGLMKLYIDFRTHKIDAGSWKNGTGDILRSYGGNMSLYHKLFLAQIDILDNNMAEARQLMEDVKNDIDTNDVEKYPLYCYFIYVNTLYNKDMLYSKKAASIVRECYKSNDDWRILWTLLFMDGELEGNKSLKLLRLKEQFNKGCTSPALYIEACNILNENIHLLRVMNSFEINVINFGARYGCINAQLCEKVAQMMSGVKVISGATVRMMENIYKLYDSDEILECFCKMLVRSGMIGPRYLPYYEKAINGQLKITMLFEYYIMSRSEDDMSPLPKILLMYFNYGNNMDYKKKAYLYADIIANKSDFPEIYKAYLPQIELYVKNQIMAGHINTALAKIYDDILSDDDIDEDNAGQISEIYFTYRIDCHNPRVKSVIVRHKESNSEKEYPVTGGVAYVKIYTDNATILFGANDGNRYGNTVHYTITRLLDNDAFIKKCVKSDGKLIHASIALYEKILAQGKPDMAAIGSFMPLAATPMLSKIYRQKLVDTAIDYYYDSFDLDGFDEFAGNTDISLSDNEHLIKVAEIYIIRDRYKEAFELLKNLDYDKMVPKRLLRLCIGCINNQDNQYDSHLLHMCYYCHIKGQNDRQVLAYLAKYYCGSTDSMIDIWKACEGMDIDLYELEERIIVQMLFGHSDDVTIHGLFEEYFAKGPNSRIVEAYFAYFSYLYFVKDEPMPESFFELMETWIENEKDLHIVCKMALTKYYSTLSSLTEFRKELARDMVMELIRKAYVFPYYTQLGKYVKIPYDISDKTIAMYKTNPANKVTIHYVINGGYVAEEMKNVYEGVFIKQFTVFYGETLEYYIWEETPAGTVKSDKIIITNNVVNPDRAEGRYQCINDIIAARNAHDGDTINKFVHTYAVNESVVDKLFEPM